VGGGRASLNTPVAGRSRTTGTPVMGWTALGFEPPGTGFPDGNREPANGFLHKLVKYRYVMILRFDAESVSGWLCPLKEIFIVIFFIL
jgi:hypothetical protein